MKLAFTGESRYPEYKSGYELYRKRARQRFTVDADTYRRVVREYCRILAAQLEENGIVDLPGVLGSIAAVELKRRPQYRGKKFIGFGKMDWEKGHYDGTFKTFGISFLPRHGKIQNLRCYGFVANRELFKRIKKKSIEDDCGWVSLSFNDKMI